LISTARATDKTGESDVYKTFGTSFSAPVIAGCAMLIREYFENGWYPCGSEGCGQGFNPSGSLVKAVLMNGAQSLKGIQSLPNGPIVGEVSDYDNNQNFGTVNLIKSLAIYGKNDINFVVVNNRILQAGRKNEIIVKAKKSFCDETELSVTISWYDDKGSYGCTNCLVNDLDLYVQRVRDSKIMWPNGLKNRDDTNNSERVRFEIEDGQKYRIVVEATNLSSQSQSYSMAATGCFEIDEISDDDLICVAD